MLGRIIARRMTSLAQPLPKVAKGYYPYPNTPKYKKLMEQQSFFCANDGKYVWQKKFSDVVLYRLTVLLVSCGFVLTVDGIRRLATPPSND